MTLSLLSVSFQSLPLLFTSKLGPSGVDSWVGGLIQVLGPCGSLQQTLLWTWELLPPSQCPQVFIATGFEALFPHIGALGCVVCLTPQLFLPVYPYANAGPPSPPAATLLCVLSALTDYSSLPLLTVWMNVSSLTPWLSDFHTVRFPGLSGFFSYICCCPSFGCARRQNVSTYAYILAGSLCYPYLWFCFQHEHFISSSQLD